MNSIEPDVKTRKELAAMVKATWDLDGRRAPVEDLDWVTDGKAQGYVRRLLTGAAIFYWINYPRCSMS